MISYKSLTPTGIFSIDKAIGIVLDSFSRFDPPKSTWKFIRLLGNTTADTEIIGECHKHSQETRRHERVMQSQQGYVDADRMPKANKIADYIDERNEELYALIMKLLAKKGFSQRAGLLNANAFKELEGEPPTQGEEEQTGEQEESGS